MEIMKNLRLGASILLLSILLVTNSLQVEAQTCEPSGELEGEEPPPGKCNTENDAECCEQGKHYPKYNCSPTVTGNTKALLTLNSFEEGGDGGDPPACYGKYLSDTEPIVALSTGWYDNRSRCFKKITISGYGTEVNAMVVDECDSMRGCDAEHAYQRPCRNHIVDGSKAVWEALGVPDDHWGELDITWTDA